VNLNRKLMAVASAVLLCLGLAATVPVMAATPSITGVEITPDPAYTDSDLVAAPSGWSNDDAAEEAYLWQWQKYDPDPLILDFVDIPDATTDILANSNFVVGDQIRVVCTPYDGEGPGTPAEDTITISGGIVSIDPSPAYVDTDLTAVPEHWAKPGDIEPTFTFQWQQWDGGGSAWVDIAGATSATLASTGFTVGDQYQVLCSADGGDPVSAETMVMGGTVEITPDPAYTDTDLLATPAHWPVPDAGALTFEYQWYKWDGISSFVALGETNATLTSDNFVKGDELQIECTPLIDSVAGTPVYDIVIISNSPPAVTEVVLTPDPAYTSSTLTATPVGWSDPDGDPEGYQWQWQIWSGTEFGDIPGATTPTLDNTNFILGDTLRVICTPYDGTDTGEPVMAEISINAFNYDAGVDVKPGSDENPVNLKSKGVIPVAILTTEGFDTADVDVTTLKFGPGEATPAHWALEDVDDDGDVDLILHFRTQSTGIAAEDTTVTLTGETTGGLAFTGTNPIKIVPSKSQVTVQGNDDAPGADNGNENAPGKIKEPGVPAEGKGKATAPGLNKEEGEKATGKAKGKDK